MESKWSLCGLCGIYVESMWSLCGVHVDFIWNVGECKIQGPLLCMAWDSSLEILLIEILIKM